jgi:cobalamin biosynthesis protein CobT
MPSIFSVHNKHLLTAVGRVLSENAVQSVCVDSGLSGTGALGCCGLSTQKGSKAASVHMLPEEVLTQMGFTEKEIDGLLDHELGHGMFSDLKSNWREKATENLVNTMRARASLLNLLQFFRRLPHALQKSFASSVMNTAEDVRMEQLYAKKYPGGAENLEVMNNHVVLHVSPEAIKASYLEKNQHLNCLQLTTTLLDAKLRLSQKAWDQHVQQNLPDCRETRAAVDALNKFAPALGNAISQASGESDLLQPVAEFCIQTLEFLHDHNQEVPTQMPQVGNSSENSSEVKNNKSKNRSSDGETFKSSEDKVKKLGLTLMSDSDPKSGLFEQMMSLIEQKAEELKLDLNLLSPEEKEALNNAKKTGLLLPTYTDDVKVLEGVQIKHLNSQKEAYALMKGALSTTTAALSRVLRLHLTSVSRSHVHRDQDVGRLDVNSLHKVTMGDQSVFKTLTRGRAKKTVVTLLLDLSGSMEGLSLDAAMQTAVALYEAMRPLGIKVEILGFTTTSSFTSETAAFYIAKSFQERDPTALASFGSVSHNCNPDPDAVRWAARRILAQPADRRILMVLSDGLPSGSGREITRTQLHDDLRAAVKAAEKYGVEVLGFGIRSSAVQQFYKKNLVITDPKNLSGSVLKELASLLLKS